MKTLKLILRRIFQSIMLAVVLLVGLLIVSGLYNHTLPKASSITEQLSSDQKAYIIESKNLRRTIGNYVWPGWGNYQIPLIVYNETNAFLTGIENPADGWMKMPGNIQRGTTWQLTTADVIDGESYYCQQLRNQTTTPENFTVKVSEVWVASRETKEYSAIKFYTDFKNQLPPIINAIFPYTLFWNSMMGKPEYYIASIEHEAFHAFQGAVAPQKFSEAQSAAYCEKEYPWEEAKNAKGWSEEMDLLLSAYTTKDTNQCLLLVRQFLSRRENRRAEALLRDHLVQYEKNREWLEGLAKYAELTIGVVASNIKDYTPSDEIKGIKGFRNYSPCAGFFNNQLDEVRRAAGRANENRFYYTGMLQAVMLDRLMPTWKDVAFNDQVYLEDLLKQAVK